MAETNKALIFKNIPNGLPIIGKDLTVEPVPYGPCPAGGVLLQSLYASIDPYQRSRMRSPSVKSYSPPFTLGDPINGRGIAKVLKSDTPQFKQGDLIIGLLPIQQHVAYEASKLAFLQPLQNPLGISDIRVFLGALGIPGVTAYAGLYEIGKPQKDETIFISAASGAVGQMVGQLAKLEGLRTIGSVGSDEKLEFITKTLGFDAGFNYKTEKPADALTRLAPEGLDIYYDNVGGEHLDAALGHMKNFGRVVMCGTIAEYNSAGPGDRYPLRNYSLIFSKRLAVRGFICSDKGIMDKYGREHQEKVQRWIKEGKIVTTTWEVEGIENSGEAFLALFSGRNFGKVVLKY
ncbi:oxidoreductase [Apodospora peruviana]|uniref:Dehydrogenase FUB6 n=1 Tax=Apodospora peruviana TaxID=516989 RepID=A0AAE0IGT0_9PEZI|nr:oxidoreductase [Apodospora peruviana]